MARSLSLSLSKAYLTTTANIRSSAVLRSLSTVPPNHDLAGDESSGTATDPLVRKLEDVIHRIMVRRSAPDWLPFLPGHSYWVPPPRSASGSLGIAQLLEKLANPLSDEESLSTTTVRGWPSSDYFIKDAPLHMDKGDVNITPTKAETATNHDNVSQSEEDDG
ncbi:hypothetical protein K2173_018084 [Erythroxylum novogranatense]|uniref:Late embryogenesis abundant protein n=1 Tax=Erythroxylum novogranatense TaxID=1862640 RepID=A0AAV8TUW3_9ROSI|nr:hypothetical protein K2173_018084 [Erythroxylum novogranatense]